MKKQKITIAQIAQEANVSSATVSRVLNHPSLVKNATLHQVEEAMRTLGCTLKQRSLLKSPKEPLIILNIPTIENQFYERIIKGAHVSAKAHGFHLLIHESPLNRSSIHNFCSLLTRVAASGVILLNYLAEDLLDQIQSTVPFVQCCEYNEETDYPFVSIDDYSAAVSAANHLISCGCSKIALINGPLNFKYARERKKGFVNALNSAEISVPNNWIIELPEINYEMAYSAVCRLLSSEIRPNGFFAISDVFAASVIRAARRYHLNIPQDIMVVGFDNIELSTLTNPSITTVNQPAFQLGYSACELLLDLIENPDSKPKSLLLDPEIIIRESTSRP